MSAGHPLLWQRLQSEYPTEPLLLQPGIWRLQHRSGESHIAKTAADGKSCFFLSNEAHWLQRLEGLPLPELIDYQQQDQQALLIYRALPGETLSRLIRHNPQPFANYPQLMAQLIALIQQLHQQGVIHADLKPNNLIIHNGRPWLIDLANAASNGSAIAERPYRGYSPSYSHPDLQQGSGHYSPDLDRFSLLVILRILMGGGCQRVAEYSGQGIERVFMPWIERAKLDTGDKAWLMRLY
ncbi:protein kinase domain-containing protein [Marinobacterium jannaschii]|uniref:protein kinase domain-containing protein n=1 Tax=Marinobacterium jannaschii TaxID=64970 RepID=UPI00047F26F3|nr:RIO1 family regulatory kinase/ATPase [Marinobacterium jannaschii]